VSEMGISTADWRMRIGQYCCFTVKKKLKIGFHASDTAKLSFAFGFTVITLLILSGVELNRHYPRIISEFVQLKEVMSEVKLPNKSIMGELRKLNETIVKIEKRVYNLDLENRMERNEIGDLCCYTDYLESKLDDLKNQSNRIKIVIFGVSEEENETWEASESKYRDVIQSNLRMIYKECIVIICRFLRDKVNEEILRK